MAWSLDIHHIDVGQGESSFLVAREPVSGKTRSMLIDGGHPIYAETVDSYIAALGVPVDHILVSHYDGDHSGGVTALLIADNVYAVSSAIAKTVAAQPTGGSQAEQIAGFASAACSAIMGAYGPSIGTALTPASDARRDVPAGSTPAQAADFGIAVAKTAAEALPPGAMQPALAFKTPTRQTVARRVAIAAAQSLAAGANLEAEARMSALATLCPGARAGSRFSTGGRYATTHLIDIGATGEPSEYVAAIAGRYTNQGDRQIQAPNTARTRTASPVLGNEVLFNSGAGAGPPPANAPAAVVVAANQRTWPGGAVFPPSGQPDNDLSIGLLVQFNNFLYWTAGDLPSEGEDLVGNVVMTQPLPKPGGGNYPQATRVACIKCGHHGADTATSKAFLGKVKPVVATLSSGNNPAFQHPTQEVVTRLHENASIAFFYMTNCNFQTTYVPASDGLNQLTAVNNKSRVAGDNARRNLGVKRNRGNIHLSVAQAQSLQAAGAAARRYSVTYWDDDAAPLHVRTEQSVF